ncbi:MAG TPA: ABC transporter permease [Patescibacteria group bacterium]|nr:ABC transporter permease [Patescibacteria group bacterium]
MFSGNVKMALASLRASKGRSLLTMFGVIIGIVSVVTTVSLGQGIKQQVVGQINRLGNNLITVRPGKLVTRDQAGNITKIDAARGVGFTSGSLPISDLGIIQKTSGVQLAVPITVVGGGIRVNGQEYDDKTIIGTNQDLPAIIKQKLAYGVFFTAGEDNQQVAVIGQNLATGLFGENAPIGMTLSIHGQDFVVRGVFERFSTSPLPLGPDFNNVIFVPYQAADAVTGSNSQLTQVLVRPNNVDASGSTIAALNSRLYKAHGGQSDFTILKPDENLVVTGDILSLFTAFVAGIGAISLLVGGIGIVNIMLVAVTERTREIGIRKAVGATNRQILGQFLIEATMLSLVGGIIGIGLSFIIEVLIRLLSDMQPVITWQIVVLATGVSLAVGIIFGITPAIKAARKDPIDALRYE